MAASTLSINETQQLTVLVAFLTAILPSGVEVILAQQNRVPEPQVDDFVVMTPLRQVRLSTNETDYQDDVLTASIAGSLMTVTGFAQFEGPIAPGMLVTAGTAAILPNTVVVAQLSGGTATGSGVFGSIGGTGVYRVTGTQAFATGTLFVGQRADLTPIEWVVQLDVHGPGSSDNARLIEGLLRSEVAVDAMATPGFSVAPLYCGEPTQRPFINTEQQYEYRWSMDAHLQVNPVIGTPQDFAAQLHPTLIEIDAAFPP